jgi:hypothetical protein
MSEMSLFQANDIKKVAGDVEDKSSKYFHMKASWHEKKDRIKKLKYADGNWVDNAQTSELMVSDFFKVLYTEDPDVNPNQLLALFVHKVNEYMNMPL